MNISDLKLGEEYYCIYPHRNFKGVRPIEYAASLCRYRGFDECEKRYVFVTGIHGAFWLTKEAVENELTTDHSYPLLTLPYKGGQWNVSRMGENMGGFIVNNPYVCVWEQNHEQVGFPCVFYGITEEERYVFVTRNEGSFYLFSEEETKKYIRENFGGRILRS